MSVNRSTKKKMPKTVKLDERYYVVRKEFFDVMHDASQAYDQLIVSFSSAILAFALGLALYKQDILHGGFIMAIGGLFFILAITCSLYSMWFRQDFAVRGIVHLNAEYRNETDVDEPFNDPVIKKMEDAQKWSGIFFVIGLGCSLIFILCNTI